MPDVAAHVFDEADLDARHVELPLRVFFFPDPDVTPAAGPSLACAIGRMKVDVVADAWIPLLVGRTAENDQDAAAVGQRAARENRAGRVAIGKRELGEADAIIELRFEFVDRRAWSRIAARPEQFDEALGIGVGGKLLPRALLVRRHDPARRT